VHEVKMAASEEVIVFEKITIIASEGLADMIARKIDTYSDCLTFVLTDDKDVFVSIILEGEHLERLRQRKEQLSQVEKNGVSDKFCPESYRSGITLAIGDPPPRFDDTTDAFKK
jgi:hypothetical protein